MKQCKTISMILTLLMLAAAGASCGNPENTEAEATDGTDKATSSDTTSTDAATADGLAAPELPEKNYDGYEFKVRTKIEGWGIYNNEHIFVEGENGEILNDAIYSRNRAVEERFNVKITEIISTADFASDITKTVMAGEDAYDLVIPTSDIHLGTEYLVDFNTLKYLSLDKPWWNQNYIEANSVSGKLCSAVGSLMITQMDSVLAMFYNQKLASDYKLPDLYALVRDGGWTLAKFFEVTKGVTDDIDGSGELDDRDRYAFVGLDGIQRLSSGVVIPSIVKDKNDIPKLNLNDSNFIGTIDKLRDFASQYEKDIYNPRTDKNTGGDGDKAVFRLFQNDQALFYVHGLGSAQMFRDMKSDFGVIPSPKLDETQDNYFITPDSTKFMVIPASAADLDRTAVILEALSYEGYTYVRPLYYETMLQSKYLRDTESVEMLDEYIYTNIGFAPKAGMTSTSVLGKMVTSLINGTAEVASTIAANEASIQETLAKYVALFK